MLVHWTKNRSHLPFYLLKNEVTFEKKSLVLLKHSFHLHLYPIYSSTLSIHIITGHWLHLAFYINLNYSNLVIICIRYNNNLNIVQSNKHDL